MRLVTSGAVLAAIAVSVPCLWTSRIIQGANAFVARHSSSAATKAAVAAVTTTRTRTSQVSRSVSSSRSTFLVPRERNGAYNCLVPSLDSHRCITTTTTTSLSLSSSSSSSSLTSPVSSNEELLPGIAAINDKNDELYEMLEELRTKPYFRLYSVDMLGSCEYIPQELYECYSETCEIYPVDDEEVPSDIKSVDEDEHDFELDGWARWDMPTDDYYDTEQFPEGYTGYDGTDVWRFIHDRIAFHDDSLADEYDDDNWKADFNKAVSGLHAMISAQVVRGIEDKIAAGEEFTEEEVWTDPVEEFKRRLSPEGETPLAIENLYFCYMLLLTSVARARERLLCDCDSGKIDDEAATLLRPILSFPLLDDPNIAVASRKLHDHAVKDSNSVSALWEARMRTRELMRIMNCVQCNKCRFHGKISVLGLSTALQVLVGRTGEGGDPTRVHRVELAALMTTLSKFSTAAQFCQKMIGS